MRQSAKLSQMVSGPPCMIHIDLNSFELSILQGVQPVGFPIFRPNSYFLLLLLLFAFIPTFWPTFTTADQLLQRFRTETKILCNKDFSSAQILRIYLHIYLASEGCAPRPLLYVKHIVNQLFLFVSGSKI